MYRSALHYGWKPDLPDKRDLQFAAARSAVAKSAAENGSA